ncbi:MAG: NADH-quinone oxidoreductase subunit NuoN [Cyanobacteriota bacterium]
MTVSNIISNAYNIHGVIPPPVDPYSTIVDFKRDIISGFLPETIIILAILALCIIALIKPKYRKVAVIYTTGIGLVIALFALVYSFLAASNSPVIFAGMFCSDPISIIFRFIMLISTLLVLAFTSSYLEKAYRFEAEFYILLLTATLGAMIMSGANDLIMVFIAMETLGISSYLLTGYIRSDNLNNEAALKYLIIGSAATAVLLFGMSYLYGLTGSTSFNEITQKIIGSQLNITLFVILIMFIAGVAYKMGAAPFHVWAPDVYQGAPTPYAAFLSVASKAAGFILMIRIMALIFGSILIWQIIFAILAILSMFIGNLTALVQTDIKRLLAYSSIAHAGYIIIGFAVASEYSISSMIYYIVIYMFMQLGAWCSVVLFYNQTGSSDIEDYAGLAYKRPLLAGSFILCLLSLAGIPITAGFFAKFYIFQAAILEGNDYLWLIIIALINSAISIYYYMYVIKTMMLKEPSEAVQKLGSETFSLMPQSKAISFALGFTVSAVIIMGIFASPIIDLSNYSVQQLLDYKANILNRSIF